MLDEMFNEITDEMKVGILFVLLFIVFGCLSR